ncbi:precorrin-6Y C5,15-methyltransferase (decarboxylating) subunit CbiT [Vibrio sonorensis]|uniref:precorrin-6Y C5,15-methyltransferase (decarboxylating) subunit CbiT n=1 Tax=Vibrio sonorensis TaxID=1004316 RepID=UPI001FDFCCDD|nr:precorrin-6Y C5,15-methyltransferase (decarboxylating) subunit CbiT [Vibrio sonorensis]
MQVGDLFAILTDYQNTPQKIASHLLQFNNHHWTLYVCEQLGGLEERVRSYSVAELSETSDTFDKLNIVVAKRKEAASQLHWGGHRQFAQDSSFSKRKPINGLITKEAVRNLALTQLKLSPLDTVWDIGAGSGSIAIEAAKFAVRGSVFAVECNVDCFDVIEENIKAHSTDNVTLVKIKAPEGLDQLPSPNAVFIGGSRGQMDGILDQAWLQLLNDGRLVVSAVTVDTVGEIYQWAKQNSLEFDAKLINVSHLQPLAHYQRYQGDNPIHLFTFTKQQSIPLTSEISEDPI